jgi:hypothetical protein
VSSALACAEHQMWVAPPTGTPSAPHVGTPLLAASPASERHDVSVCVCVCVCVCVGGGGVSALERRDTCLSVCVCVCVCVCLWWGGVRVREA